MVTVTATDSFGLSDSVDVIITVTTGTKARRYSLAAWRYQACQEWTTPRTGQAWWQRTAPQGRSRPTPCGRLVATTPGSSASPTECHVQDRAGLRDADGHGRRQYVHGDGDGHDGTNMDTQDVTVMVTNVDEMGTTLSAMQPRVGVEMTAMLSDLDMVDMSTSRGSGPVPPTWDYTDIDIVDATSASYTGMVTVDESMYLRARRCTRTDTAPTRARWRRSASMVIDEYRPYRHEQRGATPRTGAGMVATSTASGPTRLR